VSEPVPLAVKVWGDMACFTRPELKSERVSYPVMTPAAARGILESILWKPEIEWNVTAIEVLAPVRWINVRRNEVSEMFSPATILKFAETDRCYDVEDDRDQRNTLALRDVAYVIRAQIRLRDHTDDNDAKYRDMFRRRVNRGQCVNQPFLGCREFAASFGPPDPLDRPVGWDDHLGLVFWGFDYTARPVASLWCEGRIEGGVFRVPDQPAPASSPNGVR